MPDGALKVTERQFLTLLESAAESLTVRLSLYALPEVPRSDSGHRHIGTFYSGIENLWDSRLDGLIVTGAEPRTPDLRDEPYWDCLRRVIDWAECNTYSTVWSCLAAHSAVLHIDGIGRRRLEHKRFGVYECARIVDHPLMEGVPPFVSMPHSRWNEVPESDIRACGYRILTRSDDAGPDMFMKQRDKSLFIFFQGHPEYESNSLLLEYRRDAGRYLRCESDKYPAVPRGYLDDDATGKLTAFRERVLADRRGELLADFPIDVEERKIVNSWRPAATNIYRSWLLSLFAQKEREQRGRQLFRFARA